MTSDEIAQIIERMATAPFDPAAVKVPSRHRALIHQGRTPSDRADSLTYHLVQRVIVDQQWAIGTTMDEYVADLRQANRAEQSRLAVYERRGGCIAATVTPKRGAVPFARRAPKSLPFLLVIYSADRGIILSGYQISRRERTGIPRDVAWHK